MRCVYALCTDSIVCHPSRSLLFARFCFREHIQVGTRHQALVCWIFCSDHLHALTRTLTHARSVHSRRGGCYHTHWLQSQWTMRYRHNTFQYNTVVTLVWAGSAVETSLRMKSSCALRSLSNASFHSRQIILILSRQGKFSERPKAS